MLRLPTLSRQAARFQPVPFAGREARREPIVPVLGRSPRVHLWHVGCQMNDADRRRLAEDLADAGCIVEAPLDDADLAVLVTCAVRQRAEDKTYAKIGELREWKRARPGRAIALTGCMGAEHGASLLQRLPDLDYVFDVREPDGFLDRLRALYVADLDGPRPPPVSDRLSAYVPVIGGCNEMCTYCIVPFTRGRETSRPTAEVVGDVTRLVEQGVREVTLLGQNVNSYRDPGTGAALPELMAAVDAVPGLLRLRFLTSHPRNASPALFRAMRDLRTAAPQLHLPVQAGHDGLLRRMRRLYRVDEYRAILEDARSTVANLAVSTDIIVGFCGETESEFAGTERLLRELRFDVVHFAAYSPRAGTAAARRADDVPLAEKRRRLNHLLALQKRIARERNQALIGTEVEVLVESIVEDGRPVGRTGGNKVTWLPAGTAHAGELRRARVHAATAGQLSAEPADAAA